MKLKHSLTAKIFIAGLVASIAYISGISLLSYYYIEKQAQQVYLEKAQTIARSLDSNIHSRSDLSEEKMLGNIQKSIWLNPDILSLTIYTKKHGVLTSTVSNLVDDLGLMADEKNTQAFDKEITLYQELEIKDMPVLRVFIPIHHVGEIIGTMKIDLMLENDNQPRANFLSSIIVGFLIINAVVLFVFIVYVNKRVAKPAHSLLTNVNKIARGEFDVRLPITTNDELGLLSQDFNKMAVSLGQQRDEIMNAKQDMEYQATHDMLTGIPNRYSFNERIHQNVIFNKRHQRRGVLMMMDLDQFKSVNDMLGHHAGDELLKQVSRRLTELIREEDMLARLGGDEFVILISEVSNDEDKSLIQVQTIVDSIIDGFSRPFLLNQKEVIVTCSIGIVFYPEPEDDIEELLKNADSAMYKAKEDGGNCSRLFDQKLQQKLVSKVNVLNSLQNGINLNQLRLFYQPQVNDKGKLISAEALVRWLHPQKGLIQPHDFIDMAENNDLILELGEWVFKAVCSQMKSWHEKFPNSTLVPISINVSSKQFYQDDFCEQVIKNLGICEISAPNITLEISERVLLKHFDDSKRKINKLKKLGIRFAVDDLGTGFTSLALLNQLPIDEIKIDRSFVRDMMTNSNDGVLVDAIINLSHTLDLIVVAEGVENQMQFDILIEKHCQLFQGFLFDKPLSAQQFEKYL